MPFPGDLLVGAYLPWLESKWGYPTGVPVQSGPSISDVYSQFFIWKSLIAQSILNWQWPLWNPYSYSGYPLLATFHSAALYPLNLLMVFFGDVSGWTAMVIAQTIGSSITFYLLARQLKISKLSSVISATAYAFGGFLCSWSQFMTAGNAMIWAPLLLMVINRFSLGGKFQTLYPIPLLLFLLVTSGHFQLLVYVCLMMITYFFWCFRCNFSPSKLIIFLSFCGLGTALCAVQLIPTFELSHMVVRYQEAAVGSRDFGLAPWWNLITLLAPDYFGNPATGNFWGFFMYHETIFYMGISSVIAFVWGIMNFRHLGEGKYFLVVSIVGLLFGFNTVFGQAVYRYHLPWISTSDAGRVAFLFLFGTAIVLGFFVDSIPKIRLKQIISICLLFIGLTILLWLTTYFSNYLMEMNKDSNLVLEVRRRVALRNLILPTVLLTVNCILLFLSKYRPRAALWGILLVLSLDLFRFGWKYIAMVPPHIVFPETPVLEFLERKGEGEVFRVERERGEILPPNTWAYYRLMSPSGYDPMAYINYVNEYQKQINGSNDGNVSRYSNLDRYDASALGIFNVKYLMVVKRDKIGRISGDKINDKINLLEWKKVFETGSTAILENLFYQPRARFITSTGEWYKTSNAKITLYTPNNIELEYTSKGGELMLSDTWYPGWRAYSGGREIPINRCQGIFRCVKVEQGNGLIQFVYRPRSFIVGALISLASGFVYLGVILFTGMGFFFPPRFPRVK